MFPSQVAGPLEANDHFTPSFETVALSPTASFTLLFGVRDKHVREKKSKKMETVFWDHCSFLELCFTTFRDCSPLYLEQMCTEVPCAQPRTLSLVLAFSLRSVVRAGADGFQCYSKNKDRR